MKNGFYNEREFRDHILVFNNRCWYVQVDLNQGLSNTKSYWEAEDELDKADFRGPWEFFV